MWARVPDGVPLISYTDPRTGRGVVQEVVPGRTQTVTVSRVMCAEHLRQRRTYAQWMAREVVSDLWEELASQGLIPVHVWDLHTQIVGPGSGADDALPTSAYRGPGDYVITASALAVPHGADLTVRFSGAHHHV